MQMRAVLSVLGCLVLSSTAQAETLNLLIWESYVDQQILDDWSRETGVAVRQVLYDNGETRDQILADPENDIDLAVISERQAPVFGRRGVLEPLSAANLPAMADYAVEWRDRCSGFGLPYFSGTTGIVYRSDKITEAPSSWNALLKPVPALKGHIAMFDDNTDAFIAPLMLLGASLNTTDVGELKAAFEVLKAQAPYVRTYDYVISATQNPDYGRDLYMAFGYSGDQFVLNSRDGTPDLWRYAVPSEGTMSWVDCMSVIAKSPRKAHALALMERLGSAKGAAANAIALNMPTVSIQALKLLPASMRQDPALYPPTTIMAKSERLETMTAESLQTRRRIVNALINFHDAQ